MTKVPNKGWKERLVIVERMLEFVMNEATSSNDCIRDLAANIKELGRVMKTKGGQVPLLKEYDCIGLLSEDVSVAAQEFSEDEPENAIIVTTPRIISKEWHNPAGTWREDKPAESCGNCKFSEYLAQLNTGRLCKCSQSPFFNTVGVTPWKRCCALFSKTSYASQTPTHKGTVFTKESAAKTLPTVEKFMGIIFDGKVPEIIGQALPLIPEFEDPWRNYNGD